MIPSLTAEGIAALRRLEQAATKGPWTSHTGDNIICAPIGQQADGRAQIVAQAWSYEVSGSIEQRDTDAELIAAMRNALPELLSGYARALALEGMERDIQIAADLCGRARLTRARAILVRLLAALDADTEPRT